MSIKGKDLCTTMAKGHSVFKLNSFFFFSKAVELFETKYQVNSFGRTGMKLYTNGCGHMTKIAAMPIYN